MLENRRLKERPNMLCGARLVLGESVHEALVHNLSPLGCKLTLPVHLKVDEQGLLQVGLDGVEGLLEIRCDIVWCSAIPFSDSFQIGLSFREFPRATQFHKLCVLLEGERMKRESLSALESSLQEAPELFSMTDLEFQRISFLARLSRFLNRSHDPHEVAEGVVEAVAEVMRAQRILLMLDTGGSEPEVLAFREFGREALGTCSYSRSVVQRVFSTGEPVLSFDVPNDVRWGGAASLDLMGTRSILCIPLLGRQKVIGILYMDNSAEKAAFSRNDLEIACVLAELASAAIERSQYFSMLVQTEKMSALGTLTASLAHELKNPLTVMSGTADLLRDEAVDQSLVDDLKGSVDRCRELVEQVTSWSRSERGLPEDIPMQEVVSATLSMMGAEISRSKAALEVLVDPDLPLVRGHVNALSQVLVNLLTNSLQALENREDGLISLRATVSESEVVVRISDNGPGIPPANLARIFDPFFTTKAKGKGTGLGLSISRDIVGRYGGRLEVRNLATGGAQFVMSLPAQFRENMARPVGRYGIDVG